MTLGADPDRHKRLMKKSLKQEKKAAASYRGSRQPGSGAGWVRKNDVRSENLLVECKLTENLKTYTIKFSDLRELELRAIAEDRLPVLQFDLHGKQYVVLTQDDFLTLIPDA